MIEMNLHYNGVQNFAKVDVVRTTAKRKVHAFGMTENVLKDAELFQATVQCFM